MIWHIAGLAVFAALVVVGLALYHRRGLARELHARNESDGWTKRRTPMGEVWICPRCRCPVFTRQAINDHMSLHSPCGLLLDAENELDQRPAAGWKADQVGRERSNALGIEGERTE